MQDYKVEKSSGGSKISHLENKNPKFPRTPLGGLQRPPNPPAVRASVRLPRFARASHMPYLIMKPSFGVAFTSIIVSQPWLTLGERVGGGLVLNALKLKGKTKVSKNCGTGKKNILCSPDLEDL